MLRVFGPSGLQVGRNLPIIQLRQEGSSPNSLSRLDRDAGDNSIVLRGDIHLVLDDKGT